MIIVLERYCTDGTATSVAELTDHTGHTKIGHQVRAIYLALSDLIFR